jgi:hypothetical protein
MSGALKERKLDGSRMIRSSFRQRVKTRRQRFIATSNRRVPSRLVAVWPARARLSEGPDENELLTGAQISVERLLLRAATDDDHPAVEVQSRSVFRGPFGDVLRRWLQMRRDLAGFWPSMNLAAAAKQSKRSMSTLLVTAIHLGSETGKPSRSYPGGSPGQKPTGLVIVIFVMPQTVWLLNS